jgi:hypothetical protein
VNYKSITSTTSKSSRRELSATKRLSVSILVGGICGATPSTSSFVHGAWQSFEHCSLGAYCLRKSLHTHMAYENAPLRLCRTWQSVRLSWPYMNLHQHKLFLLVNIRSGFRAWTVLTAVSKHQNWPGLACAASCSDCLGTSTNVRCNI